MTNAVYRARHRHERNALAPLAALATSAGQNVAHMGRRSAIVAISSGLVVGLGAVATPATAAPLDTQTAAGTIDVSSLTAQARTALAAAPAVTVDADAEWVMEKSAIKVTPAPEPEPVREVAPAASRTAERATLTSDTAATTTSTTQATTTKAAVPQSVSGNAVLEIASRYVGVPYVSGGSSPSGFDCSGFTSYVYAQLGISLPRTSSQQRYAGTVVSRADAKPGDLIWTPGHIAIYAGGNMQIDAPQPGKTIQFRSIWQSNPTFIRVS
ncbi:C40 family peptidase [Jonesia quinghaiensis]|uniref:C40 family peptidase n=1 Tax=Jonesia quinghaiensis TaxID=262806 RepID=UPI00041D9CC2|nr:C40 family peptidase [Jonesia quinghaiensis]